MRTMTAKFPGRCYRTGRPIKPGDAIRFHGKGRAELLDRTEGVSDVIQFGDKTFYRNRLGRCEDAPCCGCCTI